jgi:hypothetical protein
LWKYGAECAVLVVLATQTTITRGCRRNDS